MLGCALNIFTPREHVLNVQAQLVLSSTPETLNDGLIDARVDPKCSEDDAVKSSCANASDCNRPEQDICSSCCCPISAMPLTCVSPTDPPYKPSNNTKSSTNFRRSPYHLHRRPPSITLKALNRFSLTTSPFGHNVRTSVSQQFLFRLFKSL